MNVSSTKQPIKFFEKYFSESGFNLLKESFYDDYIEHTSGCNVDLNNESVTYYNDGIDAATGKQNDKWITVFFQDKLKDQLNKEKELSKNLLSNVSSM